MPAPYVSMNIPKSFGTGTYSKHDPAMMPFKVRISGANFYVPLLRLEASFPNSCRHKFTATCICLSGIALDLFGIS